ncbi:hypothetical protein [Marseilla massiliensis]|uniref:Uncharacterized protein n=1 Tax=Marseilla massiliensis TaxID=1841864 RepID=A0A938WN80_9BACT|nr:hypothetical protein [Marseilla massiliensis]MBM6661143.1 hypothetical protein [Marseilla massiliensis]
MMNIFNISPVIKPRLWKRCAKRAMTACKTALTAMRKGPFGSIKRRVWQAAGCQIVMENGKCGIIFLQKQCRKITHACAP